MCRFHWPSALRQHALLKRLANPLAHVLDGEGHSCVSGLRIECLALADYYRLWPCSTRARTSSRAFCSDISWTKIPSASPTLALANQAPGRCSCTSSLEVQDTHTHACMHNTHTHACTPLSLRLLLYAGPVLVQEPGPRVPGHLSCDAGLPARHPGGSAVCGNL